MSFTNYGVLRETNGPLNQVRVQESSMVQEVGPNQEVETQVHIQFPTMKCDLILAIQVQE